MHILIRALPEQKAGAGSLSIEDGTLAVAARIKAANPAALVGMFLGETGVR